MLRRLTILLLIVGCDYAPTEHTHSEHFSCILHNKYYLIAGEIGDSLYYAIDTLGTMHEPNLNEAISVCLINALYAPY